jgi:hypothetical protein
MFKIDSRIVDVTCDYGGRYVSSMLDEEGVFDRPELDLDFDSLDTWWTMLIEMNELRYAIKKRSPLRYSVPRHSEFLTILKVMDAAAALSVQSIVFVERRDIQKEGHLKVARVILNTLRNRECDRATGMAFLTAVAQSLDESENLIHKIRVASQGRPSYNEISSLITQFSQGPLAEVIAEDAQASMVEAWQ